MSDWNLFGFFPEQIYTLLKSSEEHKKEQQSYRSTNLIFSPPDASVLVWRVYGHS